MTRRAPEPGQLSAVGSPEVAQTSNRAQPDTYPRPLGAPPVRAPLLTPDGLHGTPADTLAGHVLNALVIARLAVEPLDMGATSRLRQAITDIARRLECARWLLERQDGVR